jgi:hypothetical protein
MKVRMTALALGVSLALLASPNAAGGATGGRRSIDAARRDLVGSDALRSIRGATAPALADNFEVLSHIKFEGLAPDADVSVFDHGPGVGTFAYVGSTSFECGDARGVSIVDVSDPSEPRLVAHATGGRYTTTEDVAIERVGDRVVLGVGYQPCSDRSKVGLGLFDVTDPNHPAKLAFLEQPAGGVHELDLVTREDGRSLALLAVPFAEADTVFSGIDFGGDFRVVDITDPTKPQELTDWGVINDSDLFLVRRPEPVSFPFQGLGVQTVHFAHSVRAADAGMTAYVSYWDAGVLKFDMTDPADPVLLGRSRYPIDADGEAHSMTPYESGGTRYIFQADEDAIPDSPGLITSNVTGDDRYQALDEYWMPTTLHEAGSVSGQTFDANDGCQSEDFVGASGKIAIADLYSFGLVPPPCGIGGIVLKAVKAGATALVLNYVGEDDPFAFSPRPRAMKKIAELDPDMVAVVVGAADGMVEAIRQFAGPQAPEVEIAAGVPSFGFLRVFRETGATDADGDGFIDYPQVGRFDALAHVVGDADEEASFSWTIHNPEVAGDRLYASWYAHGIVALDISDPLHPAEVGNFVPATRARSEYFGARAAAVWGVAFHDGLIYASDLRSGLWIVRPTGPAAPTP